MGWLVENRKNVGAINVNHTQACHSIADGIYGGNDPKSTEQSRCVYCWCSTNYICLTIWHDGMSNMLSAQNTYIHTHIYTYIHTYIHTYVRTYIHTCNKVIHTYTDKQRERERERERARERDFILEVWYIALAHRKAWCFVDYLVYIGPYQEIA